MITTKQKNLLLYIARYRSKNDRSPTLIEMAEAINAHDHRSVIRMLESLQREGYLYRAGGKHRSVHLTVEAARMLEVNLSALPMRVGPESPTPANYPRQQFHSRAHGWVPSSGSTFTPPNTVQSAATSMVTGINTSGTGPISVRHLLAWVQSADRSCLTWITTLLAAGWVATTFFKGDRVAFVLSFGLVWAARKLTFTEGDKR